MIDLTTMLINLSNSLLSVQKLLSGLGYVGGIALVASGLVALKKHVETHGGGGEGGLMIALSMILCGSLLLYLPSSVSVLANTLFGVGNVLSYSSPTQPTFYNAMLILLQTTGLIWFIRGAFLISHASQPGNKEGSKGLTFFFAGVCAMNFENCLVLVNNIVEEFFNAMTYIKTNASILLSL